MPGIAMAERRRPHGLLHERVLRLLETGYPHPLSGLQLVDRLQAEGELVPPSQVYRALKRLVDTGAARKVLVAGGYVPAGPEPAVLLWCRTCGKVEAVASPRAFRWLAALGDAVGLAEPRCRIEVPGRCADCAGRDSG